jgi:CheY-like chemotaxis protein
MCSAPSAPPLDSGRAPQKAAILCVDDSHKMLLICKTILEASGYQVFTASNGKAGLEMLEEHSIDAVVIDNRMPGMTGTELAQKIKQTYKNVPILMFSDSGAEPRPLDSIDLFLNKKSGPRALRDAVASLLSEHRAL